MLSEAIAFLRLCDGGRLLQYLHNNLLERKCALLMNNLSSVLIGRSDSLAGREIQRVCWRLVDIEKSIHQILKHIGGIAGIILREIPIRLYVLHLGLEYFVGVGRRCNSTEYRQIGSYAVSLE